MAHRLIRPPGSAYSLVFSRKRPEVPPFPVVIRRHCFQLEIHNHQTVPSLRTSCLLSALVLAIAVSAAPSSETLVFGGIKRHYLVVVPASYDGTIAAPVVLAFHGKNNDGALSERTFGFTEFQNREYFIAVYPDGLNREWNGGRTPPASRESEGSDDVGFVSALIDSLATHYKIDPKRIFATGSSNGAVFCHTLAARLSERIAAIGPVNGNLGITVPKRFSPQHPVSVISFNGTDDTLMPFGGYSDPVYGLYSTPDTIAFWVKVDSCVEVPEVATLPPAVPDDGTTIKRFTFGKGPTGAEVVAYVIGHGGHTWPGNHTDPGWAKIAGRTSMGVKATEAMWTFFVDHPKP